MTPIQSIELEALDRIKEIADENGISFFLRGGSVMGAVKYKGFVPWDDDMDIAVPRQNYKKLIKLLSGNWSDKFWMASYLNGDAIHAYFPRILMKEQVRKEMGLPTNNHLGFCVIDILPLDYLPRTSFQRKLFVCHVALYRLLGATWTVDIKDTITQHSLKKQRLIRFVKNMGVQRLFTQNETYNKLDRIYSNYSSKSGWRGTITGSKFDKEMFPSGYWGNGTLMKFEDGNYLVPVKYDSYLKQIYGNNYFNEEPLKKKSHIDGIKHV